MTAQPLAQPVAFGERYSLTELLAVGGMAEIYLARQDAMAGFEKEVVIKRLKPELARDSRVVDMFLDEARICALLNHPNVVHVYDVQEHEGVPFIAMEYIRGEELNHLCRRGLELGNFLPLEHAVELIRQAAAGMGYFHAKRDAAGKGLDIVHLDISPTNLLVTEDGFLKIIDFGIARAANQRFRSSDMIPGKLSYMAPEQALRQGVDQRTDIFSLGVVLYEITVGKRLFKGPASEVITRLTEQDVEPPTFSRRNYPGPLEAVVMRALERHPDDRYQSAYDLADDLEEFLRESKLRSGPVRIARYLDELTEAGGGQRRPELVSEAEQRADDDELDFERGMFEGYRPAPDSAGAQAASEWDEYEEDESQVAAALGMDVEQFSALRTPVPVPASPPRRSGARSPAPPVAQDPDDGAGADDDDDSADPDPPAAGPSASASAGDRRPSGGPASAADGETSARPSAADDRDPVVATITTERPALPVPALLVGGMATAALATVLYLWLL